MTHVDRIAQLMAQMQTLREQLNKALTDAHGNQQDPAVLKIADEFDHILNEYMKAEKQK